MRTFQLKGSHGSDLLPESWVAVIIFSATLILFIKFTVETIGQITSYLGIYCLTIKTKETWELASSSESVSPVDGLNNKYSKVVEEGDRPTLILDDIELSQLGDREVRSQFMWLFLINNLLPIIHKYYTMKTKMNASASQGFPGKLS